MQVDVAIVGAGPAGLSLARSLSGHGLSIALIERQPRQALADPPEDGREIALTHASQQIMVRLGHWERLAKHEINRLRDAKVLNGSSPFALRIEATTVGAQQLGFLVSNQAIRRIAYEAAADCADVQWFEAALTGVQLRPEAMTLQLSDQRELQARLLVAADSRFSETRRMLGVGATMRDFGRTMLLCHMEHDEPHNDIAWEWFGTRQTLALLPLSGQRSSVVLTLPQRLAAEMQDMDEAAFNRDIARRFEGRLGEMRLQTKRHIYPLVGVYATRMAGARWALVGDAAVGMHPVTAHGYNFGLQSQERLRQQLLPAIERGADPGAPEPLHRYARAHRLATWPLYRATELIAGLYTDDRAPARLLREAGLRLAQGALPLRWAIARHLTQPA
ncbi:MAG: 5-demethoxyubiquinol-8 5-hydroxylase UbiM [Burkholderiaceae bacterium]|jgi:ubiquinone biosynthesis UbiH/UbiF/VisC/COQ6 family hydroxylase|nr:5-demethoxyubiquinol-8 5-hydroxylase UbiM [Burkholderiaceae bacterium]